MLSLECESVTKIDKILCSLKDFWQNLPLKCGSTIGEVEQPINSGTSAQLVDSTKFEKARA